MRGCGYREPRRIARVFRIAAKRQPGTHLGGRMRRAAIVVFLAFVGTSSATAQSDEGPKAGSWAAEGRSDLSGSLLRFRNPSSAWVLGLRLQSQLAEKQSGALLTYSDYFFGDVRL